MLGDFCKRSNIYVTLQIRNSVYEDPLNLPKILGFDLDDAFVLVLTQSSEVLFEVTVMMMVQKLLDFWQSVVSTYVDRFVSTVHDCG